MLHSCPVDELTITRKLGQGGNGIVWEADYARLGLVAVKQVQNDAVGQHEVEMLRRVAQYNPTGLTHSCRMFDAVVADYDIWLILEYFDLALDHYNPQYSSPFALMATALDTGKSLLELWNAGMTDDDFKPSNFALTRSGRLAHIDFGCSRLKHKHSLGYTELFAAPELLKGMASEKTAVYSWARMIEFFATGKVPIFPHARLSELMVWIGEELSTLVIECLHDQPSRRPTPPQIVARLKEIKNKGQRCRHCPQHYFFFSDSVCPSCQQA